MVDESSLEVMAITYMSWIAALSHVKHAPWRGRLRTADFDPNQPSEWIQALRDSTLPPHSGHSFARGVRASRPHTGQGGPRSDSR